MSAFDHIRRKYKHLGFSELLRTSPKSVAIYGVFYYVIGTVDREELQEFAKERGRLWHFGRAEEVAIDDRPGNDVPQSFHPIANEYRIDRPMLCELHDTTLVGSPAPTAVTRDGRIILESTKNNAIEAMNRIRTEIETHGWRRGVSRFSSPRSATESSYESLFLLAKHPEFSYYHWLTGHLPKLRGLEYYTQQTGKEPPVLIEPDPPEWVLQSLELTGLSRDRCMEWQETTATVDELVLTSHREKSRGEYFHPSTDDYRWLRDRAFSHVADADVDAGELSDRIYISRRNTDDRRVVNEREVMNELSELGFVSYELETMSVASQVKLFSEAEIIVGPHGAGLTNIVFASSPVRVIDLINENHLEPGPHLAYYYFAIAHQLGLGYEYLSCAPEGRDMRVNIDELAATIEETK